MNEFSEAQSRIFIDEQLKDMGWDLKNPNNVQLEQSTNKYRMDYVLKDSLGRPLAVVEAKKLNTDPRIADEKTKKYATELNINFIFLANGKKIYFLDTNKNTHSEELKTFISQKDLERKKNLEKIKKDILTVKIDKTITDRKYQIECIEKISSEINLNRKKFLIELATGAGKTRIAIGLCKRLFEANIISRVLFVCDRISLAIQTDKNFKKHLGDYSSYVLNSTGFKNEKNITITTLQSLISQYDNLNSGYFDIIIIDECHRSIYGEYRKTLDHFNSIKIGLTATPCKYEGEDILENDDYKFIRDTLNFFEIDKPTFQYQLSDGIKDGHLLPYIIYKAKTLRTSDENGIRVKKSEINWNQIKDNDIKQIEDLFKNQTEAIIPHSWLERKITIPSRNLAIVNEFKEVLENGFKDQNHNLRRPTLGKTIVFAVTKSHAITLAKLLNDKFKDLLDDQNLKYADYVISHNGEDDILDASDKIRSFLENKYPQILVSVGMLDTGFDCPEVTNLIFARFTKSNILYKQMRGRGSRKAPHINKKNFWIYDFVGNTDFHKDKDEGDGGVVKINKKNTNVNKKGLIELDIPDFIDPSSRTIVDIDETGTVKRTTQEQDQSNYFKLKFEGWLNKKNLTVDKEKYLRIIEQHIKSNINQIDNLKLSDFNFHPFNELPVKPENLFEGTKNFEFFLNDLNKNVIYEFTKQNKT